METNASTITTTAATPAPTKAPAKGTLLERLNELRGVLAAAVLPTGTPKPNLQLDEQHQQWRPLFQASLAAFEARVQRRPDAPLPNSLLVHYGGEDPRDGVSIRVQRERDACFIVALEKGHEQNKNIVRFCRRIGSPNRRAK